MECCQTSKILRLEPDSLFVFFSLCFHYFLFPLLNFSFSSLALVWPNHTPMMCTSLNVYTHNTWGLLLQKLIINFQASSSTHMCPLPHMYLFFSIICIVMTSFFAKLGCLAPVLTPTFPIVRLGRKGSTSAIVTAGSAGCVPQTG